MPGDIKPPPHSFLYAIGSSFLTLVFERYRLRLGGLPAPLMMTEFQHGLAVRETKLFYESYVERRSERVRLHQAKITFARFIEACSTRRVPAYGAGTRRSPYHPEQIYPPECTLAEAVDIHNQRLSMPLNMPPCQVGADYNQYVSAWQEKILFCQHKSIYPHYYSYPLERKLIKRQSRFDTDLAARVRWFKTRKDNAILCVDCGKVWLK